MSQSFVVACLQNCAGPNMDANLKECAALARDAADEGAELIMLPEYFASLDLKGNLLIGDPLPEEGHPALRAFSEIAQDRRAWILLGSVAIDVGGEKFVNRSYLLGADGAVKARYDKIHLFDVDLPGGESYLESGTVRPGDEAVLAPTPWGPLGLSICYDLRFPQLYRGLAQAGAKMLSVPAAFTKTTGEAHWHVLLRARAIECGAYVFAPCQYGLHAGDRACFGHSLIVDPWGRILADGGADSAGYVRAPIDLDKADEARRMIPSLSHDRPYAAPVPIEAAAAAAE